MRNCLAISCLFLLSYTTLQAQGDLIPKLAPNAPSTAELGRFGAVPVGLFTGTAQFTIPIFELKTNNLTVPIALNYSSNGLKVDKVASWVGYDWSLEAGGVITRKLNGPADEMEPLANFPRLTQLSNGDSLYTYLTTILNGSNVENDEYDFNFCGKSGKFFFDKNWKALSVPNNGEFKIVKSTGFTITITDNNGVVYTFLPMETNDYINQQNPYAPHNVPIGWFLTQITHPYGDIINLYYKSQSYYPTYRTGLVQSCTVGTQVTLLTNAGTSSFIQGVCGYGIASFLDSHVTTTHLDSIVTNSYGKAIFESNIDRVDLNTEYKLNKIKIETSDNDIVMIVNLNYDFVVATSAGIYQGVTLTGNDIQYRMFLNNVLINDKNNNSINNKYSFQYNNLNMLPNRLSPSQDHWGYYNGKSNNNCLFPTDLAIISSYPLLQSQITNNGFHASREPDGNYSQYGMLKQITYPTGGYTLLEYEPNKIGSTQYGGCRVKRTLDYKASGSVPVIKKYLYTTRDDLSNSKGNVFTNSDNYFKTFYRWSSSDFNTAEQCYFTSLLSNSQYGLYMSGCYHITYPTVLISYGDNFENGGEEHLFMSVTDTYSLQLGNGTNGSTLLMRTSNSGWASGTKLSETIFKMGSSGNTIPLKTEVYSYNTNESRDYTNINCLALSWSQNLQPIPYTNSQLVANYNARTYYIDSRWLPLIAKTTTTYDQNGQNAVVKVDSFTYANSNHKLVTTKKEVLSNGKTSINKYKYVPDYGLITGSEELTTDTRALYYLDLYRQISTPIEEQTLVYDGLTYKLTSGKITQYKKLSNNAVVPDSIFISNLSTPSSDITSSSLQTNSKLIFHSSYKREVSFDSYSDKSQFTQYHKINDIYSSVIWDYIGQHPTAVVRNADLVNVAYTSFEDSEAGGWTLGSPLTTKGVSVTGKRYYTISNGKISKNVNSSLVYTLTYWTKNSSPYIISGAVAGYPVKGVTINGWTYFEHRITGTSQINFGGSGDIDELRLYPLGAQMTSYTYDPLIGMTSQTDFNGEPAYYEYDSFGRLKLIRDKDGNILKTYDYHYQGQ
jgi:YD repeat-containing protein